MLLQKKVWLPILIVLLVVIGYGLFHRQKTADQEPIKIYKPIEVENPETPKPPPPGETTESGHWHGDEWHAEPHETPSADVFGSEAEKTDPARPAVAWSPVAWSNPLMPDEIPEHLKMPTDWENWHYTEAYEDPVSRAEYEQHLETIARAVIADYNPNRNIEDVWDRFIEAEKQFRSHSPYYEQNSNIPSPGGYRADWLYQQVWNFPELFDEIILPDNTDEKWVNVFHVEMGFLEPDWNLFYLHDNREFRTQDKYGYQFVAGYNEELKDYQIQYGFKLGDKHAETLTIDLDTISDAELKRIQGWDYSINPYTGKQISR